MYYDNKTCFYIKQYGPKVLVLMFSIFLIASGVFIFMANTSSTVSNPSQIASTKEEVLEQDGLKEVEEVVISTTLSSKLISLKPLDNTTMVKVKDVTSDGKVQIMVDNVIYNVNLVGIDYSKSPSDVDVSISKDLKGKDVYIAFDKKKSDENGIYIYIYQEDGTLYNKTILEKGLAILKVERTNTSLLDELLAGQLAARANLTGIWSK